MAAPKGNKFALGLETSGRPPKFEYPEEMLDRIVDYFQQNELEDLTVTGLALFLGFASRQSIYDYADKNEFSYIIKRAILTIENKYELLLADKTPTGAIFALKNMGWKDKVEQEVTGKQEVTIFELPDNGR